MTEISVQPMAGALGAEVFGVDLADLADDGFEGLKSAFLERRVLAFRDQGDLSPAALTAFAERFGTPIVHPMMKSLDGHPAVLAIVKNPEDRNNFGGSWHTDLSYLERPAMASVLHGVEIPPYGGDTLFACMYEAYAALSDGMKAMLDGMQAVHNTSLIYTDGAQQAGQGTIGESGSMQRRGPAEQDPGDVIHPVVRTHPETGRKALYVNCNFTTRFVGMTEAESAPMLQYLFRHAERPEFICRLRWRPGTVAIWDNRCAQHYAMNDYFGHRRVMRRVAIEGERPT